MICSVLSSSGLVAEARLESLSVGGAHATGDAEPQYTVKLFVPFATGAGSGGRSVSTVAPSHLRSASVSSMGSTPGSVIGDALAVSAKDVIPYGHTSPTKVFSVPGTHCSHGIVQRMTETGEFEVVSGMDGSVRTYDLLSMQLPVSLTHDTPQQPFPVGTIVLCRRRGQHGVHKGVVTMAHYDLRYTVSFSPRHFADDALYRAQAYDITALTEDTERVLHRNVQPQSYEFAEGVRVRDGVTVSTDKVYNAQIMSCLGSRRYRVLLLNTNEQAVVSYVHIGKVNTKVTQSLGAYPQLFQLFLSLEMDAYGTVSWKDARRAILAKVETFSMPVPARVVRQVLERLTVLRGGSLKDVAGMAVSDDAVDFRLSYDAFHFIAINIDNSVSLK